jgi:nucleoside 2-deoxyribosyltransferase
MKAVYISGPYSAPTNYQRQLNIHRAWCLAANVWKIPGMYAVCPHANTAHMDGISGGTPEEDWQRFIAADLDLLARCDAVLMTLGWADSRGARLEHAEAVRLGKPVFYEGTRGVWDDLRSWVRVAEMVRVMADEAAATPAEPAHPLLGEPEKMPVCSCKSEGPAGPIWCTACGHDAACCRCN